MGRIVDDRAGSKQPYNGIKAGTTFIYHGSVYISTDMMVESKGSCIAVNLESGCAAEFTPDDMVQPVEVVHHVVD